MRVESLSNPSIVEDNLPKSILICKILDHYLGESKGPENCILDSQKKPDILLSDYMIRLIVKTKPLHPVLHICHAMVYTARYLKYRKVKFTAYNAHRLALSSMLLTRKQLDDCSRDANVIYAKAGGVSLKEINLLECHLFNTLLSSHLYVSYDDIMSLYESLKIE